MFEPVKIAPSILSANLCDLQKDIEMIEEAGAGFVHVDVMDGHFVPNLSMGVPLVKQLAKITALPLDVHLMVSNPLRQIPWFAQAGADILTVHAEVLYGEELIKAVELIRELGCKAAISLKPQTPVEVLVPVLRLVDMVLIMSVEPGFSGQSYIEGSEKKVARLVQLAKENKASFAIQVDGGIGPETAPRVAAEGADILVCGNAVFKAQDPCKALRAIREEADKARLLALNIS